MSNKIVLSDQCHKDMNTLVHTNTQSNNSSKIQTTMQNYEGWVKNCTFSIQNIYGNVQAKRKWCSPKSSVYEIKDCNAVVKYSLFIQKNVISAGFGLCSFSL